MKKKLSRKQRQTQKRKLRDLKGKRQKEKRKPHPLITSIYSPRSHLMQRNKIVNDELTHGIIDEKEP